MEDKEFTLRFSLEVSFSEEYAGDDDGYAWFEEWERDIKPAMLTVVMRHLQNYPLWKTHFRSRGADPERQMEIVLTSTRS
ncbi:hypothetical protein IIA16_01665 [bacterium]|nr:hypothetical protein [bacterium]